MSSSDKIIDKLKEVDDLDLYSEDKPSSTGVNISKPEEFNPNDFIAKTASDIVSRREDTYVWKNKEKSYSAMCSTFACKVLKEAGLPLPEVNGKRYQNISNAETLYNSLSSHEDYEVISRAEDVKAGDIVFLPGTGKSGLHVGVSAGTYMEAGADWGFENNGQAGLKWKVFGGLPMYQEPGSSGPPYQKRYRALEVSDMGSKTFQAAFRYKKNIQDYVNEK